MPGAVPLRKSRRPVGSAPADRSDTNLWYHCDMATNTSISLDDHFASFLAEQVGEGRYRSVSEVVRAALRLLEEQEIQLAALRAALVGGEASGEAEIFDFDAFIAAKTL